MPLGDSRPLSIIMDRLPDARRRGKEWRARCPSPNHGADGSDRTPSLSVAEGEDGRVLIHCHAGCSLAQVLEAVGLKMADLYPLNNGNAPSEIAATYDYRDEVGTLLYQVVRKHPKGFFQRRPDGNGGSINNLRNTRKILYRLQELMAADTSELVFVVEGEKDADALAKLGLVATTNPGGAGKFRSEYAEFLRARAVVVIPDNDPPGKEHAAQVAQLLCGKAASVKILPLPGLPPRGDVSDWLANGGDREQLLRLVQETAPIPTPTQALPEIMITGRQLRDLTHEVLEALHAKNDPPRLFARGGRICRVRQDERGRPIIEELSDHGLRGEMERAANFQRETRVGIQPTAPPMMVVKDVQTRPRWKFAPLESLIQAPVLRADGSILDQPGYDSKTGLYYAPAEGLQIPTIPDRPTEEDMAAALALLEDAIQDFPFFEAADHANALALLVTAIVRAAIRGPVPLAIIDAPQKGTGKTLLAEVAGTIATGRGEHLGGPKREEEWQKLITSTLLEGTPFAIFDNLTGDIRSAALDRVLTAEFCADRILGLSKLARLPQRVTWVATSNNAQLGGDLARRCYRIRLDAKCARPWTGREFRHADLIAWVLENRGSLLAALLTLARAWFVAGRPRATTPLLGKFEGWGVVVGGILTHAGVPDLLANQSTLYQEMDEEESQWEVFLSAWYEALGSVPKSVAEVVEVMCDEGTEAQGEALRIALPDDLANFLAPGDDRRRRSSFAKRLGMALRSRKERRYGDDGLRVQLGGDDAHRGVKRWRIVKDAGLRGLAGLIPRDGKEIDPASASVLPSAEVNPQTPQTPHDQAADAYEIEERKAIQAERTGEVES